jgi:HEAT repeat protein
MWRRWGDDLYAFAILLVFTAEALTFGLLTWSFVLRLTRHLDEVRLGSFLAGTVAVTAVGMLLFGAHVLGYHVLSSRQERGRHQRLEDWTERWVGALFGGKQPPAGSLPREAVESLLDLRETLRGVEGDRIEAMIRRYGIGERLLRQSQALEVRGVARVIRAIQRRRLSARLEALEGLAKARLPWSFDPLMRLLGDRGPAVRIMALRGLARTVGRMRAGPSRDRAADRFAEACTRTELPAGAIEESLLLLEDAAPRVLARVLAEFGSTPTIDSPAERPALLNRVLDAVGRLKLLDMTEEVASFAVDPDPEVRAAAFRALARLGLLPPGADQAVAVSLHDPIEFVRVQAVRAAALLGRDEARHALWDLLGDESWWVRRSAAQTLVGMGTVGPATIKEAAARHPDRYARHMAVQVLLEAGRLDPARARRMREAM